MRSSFLRRLSLLALLSTLAPSCIDPVHTDEVDALGDEVAGVREGPLHRPGQPCFACHGGSGPGPDFAIAGTVYAVKNQPAALPGVIVTVTDATGTARSMESNAAGNFYITANQWSPAYPLYVQMKYGAESKDMNTRIGRIGGCNTCHRGTGDATQMPAVYMREQ